MQLNEIQEFFAFKNSEIFEFIDYKMIKLWNMAYGRDIYIYLSLQGSL